MTATINVNKLLAASVIAVGLVACSSENRFPTYATLDKVLAEQTGQDGRACVRTMDVRGFAFDDGVLKLPSRGKYFIATTLHQCHDLEFSHLVGFESQFGEACGPALSVYTRDSRCPIRNVYEFKNRQEAFAALDQANKKVAELKAVSEAENGNSEG